MPGTLPVVGGTDCGGAGRRIVSQILTPWVRDGEELLRSEVCRPGSMQEHSLLLQSGTRALLHTLYPHGQDSWCTELGGKQMNEAEAVLVDWKPARCPRMCGVEDRGCGRVQARGPP